jgi:hypothetical protein
MSSVLLPHPYPMPADAIVVTVPWTPGLSKNRQHGHHRRGVYLTADAQAARDQLTWTLKSALATSLFLPRRKVWLAITVQRANVRSDPINVLDAVADAIKVATGIDDRWFAVARLDWTVVRDAPPTVTVAVWQDSFSLGGLAHAQYPRTL